MTDLQDLIRQRGVIRGRITLFEKHLSPLMKLDVIAERNKLINNELSLRLSKFQELSYTFEEVQSKIEELDPDSSSQMDEREQTENRIFQLIGIAQEFLDVYNDCKFKRGDESSCRGSTTSVANHIKLPPLKISPFNGDINKWLQFRDMYLSLIHNNETIDDVSKFHYLKSYLEGSALSVIDSVNVSANNYQIAWSLLCDRYNNKRLLINEHVKCLFSIEALSKESDRGLRNLVDTISKNLSALKLLGEPTDSWSTLIIYIASSKLDSTTARNWEEFRSKLETQSLDDFFNFLRQRATVLETVYAAKASNSHNKVENRQTFNRSKSFISSSFDSPLRGCCLACKQDHKLYDCNKFKNMSVEERNAKVYQWKICSNCLRNDHQSYQCRLAGCRICKRRHNTLLHKQSSFNNTYQSRQPQPLSAQPETQNNVEPSTSASLATTTNLVPNIEATANAHDNIDNASSSPTPVVTMSAGASNLALLSTALVEVSNNGNTIKLRALLDSGSQSSFITEAAQIKLGCIKNKNQCKYVSGLNNATVSIAEHCNIQIKSTYNQFTTSVKCYVVPIITDNLPQTEVQLHDLGIPGHIELADPTFFQPSDIDLLLGADVFWDIMGSARVQLGQNKPILQETRLGWIVAGRIGGKYFKAPSKIHCNFSKDIEQQLVKFWELEEIPTSKSTSNSEDYCETLYRETTYRDENGRYCVQIPLCDSPNVLGDSYHIAEKRLLQMERKMKQKPEFKQEYIKFMQEYERLGHMTEVTRKPDIGCFLPHHAVIKNSSETTRLRAVFDGSAKTSSGISFNEIQHVGPVVQDDLFSILLRFRQHKYVVTADVEKMYRQILVQPEQRHLQMILWREHGDKPIKIYKLNTITYGTSSASFLSTRCLIQLADECCDDRIANIIKHDFYIDDLITGSSSMEDVCYIINSITETLHSAHLPLRKFRTNVGSVLQDKSNSLIPKDLDFSAQSSALGLKWDPSTDTFNFPVDIKYSTVATKRSILSDSARLFDPLGLLSVCTIVPKIILQKLWMSKLEWDDPIPTDISKMWQNFVLGLKSLVKFRIPRFVLLNDPDAIVEMHTFCDASQDAYAACVYLRSINSLGEVEINLICAKTKVAPVRAQTIPRLELCGALLAARLSSKVIEALRLTITIIYYWTDSSVVLGWIHSPSQSLKTFVCNRVAQIQELTANGSWRHVPGVQNPADLASRGLNPSQVIDAKLWWHGPSFLQEGPSAWPEIIKPSTDFPEIKTYTTNPKTKAHAITSTTCTIFAYTTPDHLVNFENFSKFTILLRSMAYALRFINNIRHSNAKITGHLTTNELQLSLHHLIKQHQKECFNDELALLNNKRFLPSKSRLLSLRPFLDERGILRVGGRIQNSPEIFSKKHPVILDSKHQFTKLLFIHEHKKLCHGGAQLLLTHVRQLFWPITGRRLARSTINNCRICRILRTKSVIPIMGNLPSARVNPSFAFEVAGVDFAGPFPTRDRKGRGCRIIKSYLCIFVCFTTKALHLEIASDLSTEAFKMCLTRFISRRGKPSVIHCDNGRNFVGACNEFKRFLESCGESISSYAAGEFINFKFSPAYSPHFNGLSEAGVKAAKHHLTRMIGNTNLTFEELATLFAQVEAILNSRPLTPLSADPNDFYPLCPGHFLIGRPLTSTPSPALIEINPNRLSRHEQIERIRQQFWERWRTEYLNELQQRSKWRINEGQLFEGDMVVIKEANLPPLKWRMGRIHRLYPGPDGIARVADVNTSRGIIRRAITNLCPLPNEHADNSKSHGLRGGEDV